MPTPLEEELLAMMRAEQQRRQATGSEVEASPMPSLDLLFASERTAEELRQHLEGARGAAQRDALMVLARVMTSPGIPEDVVFAVDSTSMEANLIRGRVPMSMSTRAPNENGDALPDLSIAEISDMLMSREARIQADLAGIDWSEPPPSAAYEIEFDNDDGPGRTEPNEAARWRVGRDSPPSVSMVHRDTVPTGGRVVSTRGEDGRFRPSGVPEAARTVSLSPRPAFPRSEAQRTGSTLPVAPERQDRSSIPTALERLTGADMFDDD